MVVELKNSRGKIEEQYPSYISPCYYQTIFAVWSETCIEIRAILYIPLGVETSWK